MGSCLPGAVEAIQIRQAGKKKPIYACTYSMHTRSHTHKEHERAGVLGALAMAD